MLNAVRALSIAALLAGALLISSVSSTAADPGLDPVRPHRHFVELADGTRIEVGPRVCDNPAVQQAFNQFHNNLHRLEPGAIGPLAPGLHGPSPVEVKAGGC